MVSGAAFVHTIFSYLLGSFLFLFLLEVCTQEISDSFVCGVFWGGHISSAFLHVIHRGLCFSSNTGGISDHHFPSPQHLGAHPRVHSSRVSHVLCCLPGLTHGLSQALEKRVLTTHRAVIYNVGWKMPQNFFLKLSVLWLWPVNNFTATECVFLHSVSSLSSSVVFIILS